MGYEHEFVDVTRTIAVDHGILLRMQTAAIAWLIPITAVRQATGIPVVTNGKNFAKIRTRDDCSDLEAFASCTTRKALG